MAGDDARLGSLCAAGYGESVLGSRAGGGEGGPTLGFLSTGIGDLCLEHREESVAACTNLMSCFGHAIHVCTACYTGSVSSGPIGIGRSKSSQHSSVIRSTKTLANPSGIGW